MILKVAENFKCNLFQSQLRLGLFLSS